MLSVLAVLIAVTIATMVVVGPIWLLRVAVESNKKCPFCRRRLAARRATTCGSCGNDITHPARRSEQLV